MKLKLFICGFFVWSCFSAPATFARDMNGSKKILEKYTEQFVDSWNRKDGVGLSYLYTSDAVLSVSGLSQPIYGREGIRANIIEEFSGISEGATLTATILSSRFFGEEIIVGNGTWESTTSRGDRIDGGLFGNVWKIVDGKPLMYMESTNQILE